MGFARCISYSTTIHVLTLAASLYRLPLMPFVLVLAALWLASPRPPETRGRWLAVTGLAVAFLAGATHYLVTVLP